MLHPLASTINFLMIYSRSEHFQEDHFQQVYYIILEIWCLYLTICFGRLQKSLTEAVCNKDDPLLTANDQNHTRQPLPPTTSFGLSTTASPGDHKISNDLWPIWAFQEDHFQQLYYTILYSKSGVCVWQYASVDYKNLSQKLCAIRMIP